MVFLMGSLQMSLPKSSETAARALVRLRYKEAEIIYIISPIFFIVDDDENFE